MFGPLPHRKLSVHKAAKRDETNILEQVLHLEQHETVLKINPFEHLQQRAKNVTFHLVANLEPPQDPNPLTLPHLRINLQHERSFLKTKKLTVQGQTH